MSPSESMEQVVVDDVSEWGLISKRTSDTTLPSLVEAREITPKDVEKVASRSERIAMKRL